MKNNMRPTLSAIVIFFLLLHAPALAQESVSRNDTLYSSVLQEKRPIRVILPPGYKQESSTRHDVLYVLDGEWNTSLTEKLCDFLRYGKFIPQNLIVVSIPNLYKSSINMRSRDFTPSHIDEIPISGGAANFLAFLKEELVPYINKAYPTAPGNNTLYGTSFGGLFGVYAFLHTPDLFRSYLLIEPALSYDNEHLIKQARKMLSGMQQVDNTLWIASRDKIAFKAMGVAEFDSLLVQQAPKGLDWKVQAYADETHFSAIWKGIYDGLRFSYKGLITEEKFFLEPTNGRIVKAQPFRLRCYNVGAESFMGYTIDGSEPTSASPKLKDENTFNFSGTTTLIVKALNNRKENDKTFRSNFIAAAPLTPADAPKNATRGELACRYYTGKWAQLPDLGKLQPDRKGKAGNNFDTDQFKQDQDFAFIQEGLLEIPEEAYYLFGIEDGNHAKLYIGGEPVIEEQQAVDGQSFIIYLRKGFYTYTVERLHKKGDRRPSPVYWRKDSEAMFAPIPGEYLYMSAKK